MTKHQQSHESPLVDKTEIAPRLEGQLVPDVPVEISLQPGERLDLYAGSQAEADQTDPSDPDRFSVISLQDAERHPDGAIIFEGRRLSPQLTHIITQPGVAIDWAKGTGLKGLRKGQVVDMGRSSAVTKDRFAFSDKVSRDHFTIAVDETGALMIADNGSTNGTAYKTVEVAPAATAEVVDEATVEPRLEDLPESVQAEVLSYQRAVMNKREAETAKQFSQAAEDGRLIYRIRQGLSDQARAFLGLR